MLKSVGQTLANFWKISLWIYFNFFPTYCIINHLLGTWKIISWTKIKKKFRTVQAELEHEIQSAAAENDKSESELDELRQNCRKSKEAERNAKKSFDDVMRKKKIKMSEVSYLLHRVLS